MKIAWISDLHISPSKSRASDFKMDPLDFANYLATLDRIADLIIINGDLFEEWQSILPFRKFIKRDIERAEEEYRTALEFIRDNKKIKIVEGNHDDVLHDVATKYGMVHSTSLVVTMPDGTKGKIYSDHGVYDAVNSRFRFVGFLVSWLVGILERVIGSEFDIDLMKWARKALGISVFKNSRQIKKAIQMFEVDDSLRVVCFGHTHLSSVVKMEVNGIDRVFINSGSFGYNSRDITIYDTSTGKVRATTSRVHDYRKIKRLLKPGDVVLTYNNEGFVDKLIASATGEQYAHALVYVGGGNIVEAIYAEDKKGVVMRKLTDYTTGTYDILILRPHSEEDARDIVKYVRSRLGRKYSLLQIVWDTILVALRIRKYKTFDIDVQPKSDVCSELVAQALVSTGRHNDIPLHSTITPTELSKLGIFREIYSYNALAARKADPVKELG